MPRDVIAGSESMSICNFNNYRQLTLKMWASKLHSPNIFVTPLTTLAVTNIFNSSRWIMDENGILPLHFFPIIICYLYVFQNVYHSSSSLHLLSNIATAFSSDENF